MKMDRNHPYGALQRHWRRRRMSFFSRAFQITESSRVLDVGGTCWNWTLSSLRPRLTILNLFGPQEPLPPGVDWKVGDACNLKYGDGEFDVVYSNSVIEHLGSRERQEAFAREIRRVGRAYFVQTPNRWFPVEPHLLTPFIHFLPRRWQRPLYPLTGWGLLYRPTQDDMNRQFEELRLLDRTEFGALFPEARIATERVAGFPKSFMALHGACGGS
jgi:hypothetical protein